MLNTNDIKQISQLLDEKLDQKFDVKLEPIQKELKKHGKLLRSLKRDQDTMLKMLDKEQMKQSKRLEKIEQHVGIPTSL